MRTKFNYCPIRGLVDWNFEGIIEKTPRKRPKKRYFKPGMSFKQKLIFKTKFRKNHARESRATRREVE